MASNQSIKDLKTRINNFFDGKITIDRCTGTLTQTGDIAWVTVTSGTFAIGSYLEIPSEFGRSFAISSIYDEVVDGVLKVKTSISQNISDSVQFFVEAKDESDLSSLIDDFSDRHYDEKTYYRLALGVIQNYNINAVPPQPNLVSKTPLRFIISNSKGYAIFDSAEAEWNQNTQLIVGIGSNRFNFAYSCGPWKFDIGTGMWSPEVQPEEYYISNNITNVPLQAFFSN